MQSLRITIPQFARISPDGTLENDRHGKARSCILASVYRSSPPENQVRDDGGSVGEAEERVIGEDGGDAEEARVEHGLVRQGGEGGMTVDDRDTLAQQHVADQRQ